MGSINFLTQYPVLTLLLICHVLGDFYLKNPLSEPTGRVGRLGFLYALPFLGLSLVVPGLLFLTSIALESWLLLILLEPWLEKTLAKSRVSLFWLKQLIQLSIILPLALWQGQIALPAFITNKGAALCLFVLLINRPVNTCFRLVFKKYQPQDCDTKTKTIEGAGATIGLLERMIMGLCLIMGQFAFIGLVFTAKSIARYDKISKDPAFAEYYLIGSLFSILSVLFFAWLCL